MFTICETIRKVPPMTTLTQKHTGILRQHSLTVYLDPLWVAQSLTLHVTKLELGTLLVGGGRFFSPHSLLPTQLQDERAQHGILLCCPPQRLMQGSFLTFVV